jgi:hypothetical protein
LAENKKCIIIVHFIDRLQYCRKRNELPFIVDEKYGNNKRKMKSFPNENPVENIMDTLIGLPEYLRKPILEGRLKEFYTLDGQDKHEIVSSVLRTIPSFEEEKISRLIRTWMMVLSSFNGAQIVEMLRIYCQELRKNPDIIQRMRVNMIIRMFNGIEDVQKEKLADCLKEAILSFPDRNKIIDLIPQSGLQALGIQ